MESNSVRRQRNMMMQTNFIIETETIIYPIVYVSKKLFGKWKSSLISSFQNQKSKASNIVIWIILLVDRQFKPIQKLDGRESLLVVRNLVHTFTTLHKCWRCIQIGIAAHLQGSIFYWMTRASQLLWPLEYWLCDLLLEMSAFTCL